MINKNFVIDFRNRRTVVRGQDTATFFIGADHRRQIMGRLRS
jgi:hypothetical protein